MIATFPSVLLYRAAARLMGAAAISASPVTILPLISSGAAASVML
jgi:hypothetical protein